MCIAPVLAMNSVVDLGDQGSGLFIREHGDDGPVKTLLPFSGMFVTGLRIVRFDNDPSLDGSCRMESFPGFAFRHRSTGGHEFACCLLVKSCLEGPVHQKSHQLSIE